MIPEITSLQIMEDIMSFVESFKNNIFDILNKHSSEVSNFESIKNYINSSTDLIEVHKKFVSKINLDFTLILLQRCSITFKNVISFCDYNYFIK